MKAPSTSDREARAAGRIAAEAGRLLVELRSDAFRAAMAPEELRRLGDQRAHEHIAAALHEAFPDDAILSEEARDDPRRLAAARVWIVDPLDGTREYGEADRCDWAVHVAFLADGQLRAGAVALPGLDLTLSTAAPPQVPPPRHRRPRLLVSRTRPPAFVAVLQEELGVELIRMGSAGAKAMAVVRGEADVYAHAGGQYEWDSAAPAVVAAAAGLHVSRMDGAPLVYNQPDPYLPDVLICRPELADRVIAAAR